MAMSQRMWRREQERKRRERMKRLKRRRNCTITVLVLAVVAVAVIVKTANKREKATQVTPIETTTVAPNTNTLYEPSSVYTTNRDKSDINAEFFNNSAFAGNSVADSIAMYGLLDDVDFYTGVNIDLDNVYTVTNSGGTVSVADQFKNKSFKKIFLSFGENEMLTMSAGEFKESYNGFVEKIKEYQPNAKIYMIGIPPVTLEVSNGGDVTKGKVNEFNKQIKSIAFDKELYYVDSVDALGDNKGFLPNSVSADGINLNKAAVTDLLYYTSKKAYIPESSNLIDEDDDEDKENDTANKNDKKETEKATEKATEAPQATSKNSEESPEPTVNVLKNSVAQKKADKED